MFLSGQTGLNPPRVQGLDASPDLANKSGGLQHHCIAAALIHIHGFAGWPPLRFMKKMPGIFLSCAAGVAPAASLIVTTLRAQVVQDDL